MRDAAQSAHNTADSHALNLSLSALGTHAEPAFRGEILDRHVCLQWYRGEEPQALVGLKEVLRPETGAFPEQA